MLDEKLLRNHLNSYALTLYRDTYDQFRRKLYDSPKGKLYSRKKNIYITAEPEYAGLSIRASIKATIDQIPCQMNFSFNYEGVKNGQSFLFDYNLIQFRPYFFPFSVRGDEFNVTYQTEIPFMIWMTEDDQYVTSYCLDDYRAILDKNTTRLNSMKLLYGEEYASHIKKYFSSTKNKRFNTVFEARIAASKMMDRFLDFMEEVAWEEME